MGNIDILNRTFPVSRLNFAAFARRECNNRPNWPQERNFRRNWRNRTGKPRLIAANDGGLGLRLTTIRGRSLHNHPTTSRKMRIVVLFAAALCTAALAFSSAFGEESAKVLLIGKKPDHPFGSHMYLHTCGMLAKCLEKTKGVKTVVSDGWPKDEATLEGVNTIVVYTSPAAEFLLDAPHREQFEKLMNDGVGLVTIHWASSVNKANFERLGPRWLSYLGGTWVSNVGLSTDKSNLKQLIPDHPVCRGWKEYELHDEFYLNPTIEKARPLLQVHTKEKDVVVAWVHEREDGGRAMGTTLGHFYRNFQIPAFRRMVVNGILWSAHVDVPEAGAPIDISDADLALPPRE